MDADAVNSLLWQRNGVLSAVEHIFNETAMHARAQASNCMAKANRASHGPRVRAKARVKKTWKIQRNQKWEPRCQRLTQGQHIERSPQVLKIRKLETRSETLEFSRTCTSALPGTMVGTVTNGTMAGVLMSGKMTGWSRSECKGKSKASRRTSNGKSKVPKVPKVRTGVKSRKLILRTKKLKSETSLETQGICTDVSH